MIQVNLALRGPRASCGELHPADVFQLVAGTSTGGLIALMLEKIGLTVEECVTEYEELSKVVFGKKHLRGRICFGLANARYSGRSLRDCVCSLLRERQLDEDLSMRHDANKVAWWVPAVLRICPGNNHSMPLSQNKDQYANKCATVLWFSESIAHPRNTPS